jgi:SH3-like domain-containing protein
MKITNVILAIFLIFIATACSKVNNKDMTVIKDCTGSYLRFNGNDYHICNIEIVENFDSGTEVEASFKKIDECDNNWAVCQMIHDNEGWINVTKIK